MDKPVQPTETHPENTMESTTDDKLQGHTETAPPAQGALKQTTAESNQTAPTRLTVVSKKVKVQDMSDPLAIEFTKHSAKTITSIYIEGNSYSLDFCRQFGEYLKEADNIEKPAQKLNMNDAFVARLKDEIPASIEAIARGLIGKNLRKLDISNNAVNPYGARGLLVYLEQATSLEVLLIDNCGLGTAGAAEIANGLKHTPNLKVLSIGRNRMEDAGTSSIAEAIPYLTALQQLFIYQNGIKQDGLAKILAQVRTNCKHINQLDLCDNFVRGRATIELAQLIENCCEIKNLNLSDCLVEAQNDKVIASFERTPNRQFERIGINFIELSPQLALQLLEVLKHCPIKRLDVVGNQFPSKVKKAYRQVFPTEGVLSSFVDDQDEQTIRLFVPDAV